MERWMHFLPVFGAMLNLAAAVINLRIALIKRRARPDETGAASA